MTRTCKYEPCSTEFEPRRPHQVFHSTECRYAAWAEEQENGGEDGAQRVDGGVGRRGGNVRSVGEARQLQTASKDLDRWRLAMELQVHRTLLDTGRFHVDDLDGLNLPPAAFEVRGTLVNSIRCSGVMESTGEYRKVAHAAANARKAPIYRITEKGRQELSKLAGVGGTENEGSSPSHSGESSTGGRGQARKSMDGPADATPGGALPEPLSLLPAADPETWAA